LQRKNFFFLQRCKRDALPTELIARELILPCIATKIESENEKFF
jgi:hypothetical protein